MCSCWSSLGFVAITLRFTPTLFRRRHRVPRWLRCPEDLARIFYLLLRPQLRLLTIVEVICLYSVRISAPYVSQSFRPSPSTTSSRLDDLDGVSEPTTGAVGSPFSRIEVSGLPEPLPNYIAYTIVTREAETQTAKHVVLRRPPVRCLLLHGLHAVRQGPTPTKGPAKG